MKIKMDIHSTDMKKKLINVYYANVAGLLSKDIDAIYESVKRSDPDIICFVETHVTDLTDTKIYDLSEYGYSHIAAYSNSAHTGGVLIYIRHHWSWQIIGITQVDYYFWSVSLKIKVGGEHIFVSACYRSPSCNLNEFLLKYEEVLNKVEEATGVSKGTIICIGDYNIDWNGMNSRRLNGMMNAMDLRQIVAEDTRVSRTSSTLIDLVFTNNRDVVSANVRDALSDHESILLKIPVREKPRKIKEEILFPGKINFDVLNEKLRDRINEMQEVDTLDEKVDTLIEIVTNGIDTSRGDPILISKRRYNKFFTRDVLKCRRDKEVAYRRFRWAKNNDADEAEIEERWNDFKIKRNKFVAGIRKAKREYFTKKINECGQDSAKMWKVLKELTTVKTKAVSILEDNGVLINDQQQIADKLNVFFVKSIEDINLSIPDESWTFTRQYEHGEMTSFTEPTEEKILEILKKDKNKSSTQPNAKVMIECWQSIGPTVMEIVTRSLEEGIVPSNLKIATITPIPKIPSAKLAEDFRPVNVLPALDKVVEAMVYEDLLKFTKENDLLTSKQSGFREKHSTETSVLLVFENWRRALDKKRIIIVVFLDFKRAFETVDRRLLLMKLKVKNIKLEELCSSG